MKFNLKILCGLMVAAALMASQTLSARTFPFSNNSYEVTITNLTYQQSFTPILVASHRQGPTLFELGSPASPALEQLAEGGDTGPLMMDVLGADPQLVDMTTTGGLLEPGQSITVTVSAVRANRLSVAAMLIPTNDGFLALNAVPAPKGLATAVFWVPAYDAGSEFNDESCDNIPGPSCGGDGEGYSPVSVGEEGFVHIHRGIHGIADDLQADEWDWRNPVARIMVRRILDR